MLENQYVAMDHKIGAIEIENEALDREIESLLEKAQVTSEQLTLFLSNPVNFTEANWATLLKEKEKLKVKLERDLQNIAKPAKKLAAIPPHWLFVR